MLGGAGGSQTESRAFKGSSVDLRPRLRCCKKTTAQALYQKRKQKINIF